jgi:hypothetical protein
MNSLVCRCTHGATVNVEILFGLNFINYRTDDFKPKVCVH